MQYQLQGKRIFREAEIQRTTVVIQLSIYSFDKGPLRGGTYSKRANEISWPLLVIISRFNNIFKFVCAIYRRLQKFE